VTTWGELPANVTKPDVSQATERRRLIDERHLRVRLCSLLFAERRVRRPSAPSGVLRALRERIVAGARERHGDMRLVWRDRSSRRARLPRRHGFGRDGDVVHGFGFQPMPQRFRDERCPDGSGWAKRSLWGWTSSRSSNFPDSGRTGWFRLEALCAPRGDASDGRGWKYRHHLGQRPVWRMGPQPRRPARAGQAAWARAYRGSDGSWLCSWAALIADAGEVTRRRKASWFRWSGCLWRGSGGGGSWRRSTRAGPRSGSNGAVATEGVRGQATCSTAAEHAAVGRHGVEGLSIEALPGPRGAPPGPTKATWRVVARLKLEVRRQAKLHLMTRAGSLRGRKITEREGERGRDSGSAEGARTGVGCRSRRDASFSPARRCAGQPVRNRARRDSSRRPASLWRGRPGSRRATGCEVEPASVNNERDSTCSDRKIRDEPTEGALVSWVLVVLTGRRARQARRGGSGEARVGARSPRGRRATESVRGFAVPVQASSADGRRESVAAGRSPRGERRAAPSAVGRSFHG